VSRTAESLLSEKLFAQSVTVDNIRRTVPVTGHRSPQWLVTAQDCNVRYGGILRCKDPFYDDRRQYGWKTIVYTPSCKIRTGFFIGEERHTTLFGCATTRRYTTNYVPKA
jgi:hypothetical protein